MMKSFKELKKITKEGARKSGLAVSRFDGFIVCIRDDDSQEVKEFIVDRESFSFLLEKIMSEDDMGKLEQSGCWDYDY